jgi:hypothetical protein
VNFLVFSQETDIIFLNGLNCLLLAVDTKFGLCELRIEVLCVV